MMRPALSRTLWHPEMHYRDTGQLHSPGPFPNRIEAEGEELGYVRLQMGSSVKGSRCG